LKLDLDLNELPVYKQLAVKRTIDGLSQSEQAEKLNIPQGTLSRIETGSIKIPRKFYAQVIDYLYGGLE